MVTPTLNFDHAHHKLKIRGLKSPVDVLTFTGREQLSAPFRYDIQFTSTDKAIEPESVLMQDGAFSLTAPPVQGMPVQAPCAPCMASLPALNICHRHRTKPVTKYGWSRVWRCWPAAARMPSTRI
ncbi:VGR-related protein [Escherichia coli]|nr:VGR-related protein [Escherichia coli]SQT68689.1 VGR-related protein [Escherichia coli]SQT73672.1 VGR-related protein [Escherichia coli]SQU31943.1 VGR-related protein [Escherichia coli]SQU40240.1 VGR-related protein [Escherichia coli]